MLVYLGHTEALGERINSSYISHSHGNINIIVFLVRLTYLLYISILHVSAIGIKSTCSCTGLNRPLGLQEVEVSRIFRQTAREGSKVVSLTHRPPLPPLEIPLVLISVNG